MPFSEAEKIAYPPFRIVEPVWDAEGVTDAQKARSLVAIGYALGTLDKANTTDKVSGGKKWLEMKLGLDIKLDASLREKVLNEFDNFCERSAPQK